MDSFQVDLAVGNSLSTLIRGIVKTVVGETVLPRLRRTMRKMLADLVRRMKEEEEGGKKKRKRARGRGRRKRKGGGVSAIAMQRRADQETDAKLTFNPRYT